MFCPTQDDNRSALLRLLPRGRAWRNEDGGPEEGSVLYQFWDAVAGVLTYLTDRLCALRLEMFCQTMTETNAEWLAEYGLPNACDPFPDLCDKVSALGGQTCEYFNERIARLGWRAECFQKKSFCGSRVGCAMAGCATTGDRSALSLIVKVHTGDPDLQPTITKNYRPALAGRFRAGHRPSCDTITVPGHSPVRCLMERIAPAHVQVQYVF